MANNVISTFQMKAFKTHRFNFAVPSVGSVAELSINHNFSGKFVVDYSEDKWRGIVMIYYSAKSDDTHDPFNVEIVMDGRYEYEAPKTDADKAQFKKLLTMNGAVALITMLRGQVATTTTALGLTPSLIVPSVNLNHFHWEEQELPAAAE